MSARELVPISALVADVSSWNPAAAPPDKVIRYIDLSAVDQETKTIVGARDVTCSEAPSRARQLVEEGDVLISTVRPNLNGVARVPRELHGATASTGFCVLRPSASTLDGRYLFHWVRTSSFVSEMVRRATGANYPAVSNQAILDSLLPLPSLAAQQHIAGVLDRAEALRTARRSCVVNLDALAHAIFEQKFGDPKANAMAWPTAKLGELLDIQWGNTSITKESYVPAGVPAYSASGRDGFLKVAENSGEGIVLSAIGARCGKCFYVPGGEWTAIKNTIVLKPLPVSPVEILFLFMIVNNEQFWPSRGAGQPFIALGTARNQTVPLPPLPAQREFVRIMKCVERLKIIEGESLLLLDGLFASLQQRAFDGTL